MTQNRVLEVSRLQGQAPVAAGNNSYFLRAVYYVLSEYDYWSSYTPACSSEGTSLWYARCTRV
jgi:hypothetical protein